MVSLIDQVGTGPWTFEVRISDTYEGDVEAFGERYSAPTELTMERAVLPAWRRRIEERMK